MNTNRWTLLGLAIALPTALVVAEESATATKPAAATAATILEAAELKWVDGPASLPAGARMVVLDGDPRNEGPFTIRLKMPPGYKIPPHTHPAAERITVISGTVHLGIGEKFEESAGRELKAGAFAVVPAGLPHFAWSRGEAVLQIHSEGPFQRKFVDAADEPGKR